MLDFYVKISKRLDFLLCIGHKDEGWLFQWQIWELILVKIFTYGRLSRASVNFHTNCLGFNFNIYHDGVFWSILEVLQIRVVIKFFICVFLRVWQLFLDCMNLRFLWRFTNRCNMSLYVTFMACSMLESAFFCRMIFFICFRLGPLWRCGFHVMNFVGWA